MMGQLITTTIKMTVVTWKKQEIKMFKDAGESSSSSSEMTYDIGKTFKEYSVDNLTDHQKYLIVKNRSIPGS